MSTVTIKQKLTIRNAKGSSAPDTSSIMETVASSTDELVDYLLEEDATHIRFVFTGKCSAKKHSEKPTAESASDNGTSRIKRLPF